MRILITGIAGFLGARFADWLARHQPDAEITGIDDFSGGYAENVPPSAAAYSYTLGVGDPRVPTLFERRGFEYVFHFAAYAAEALSPFIRRYNYRNNLLATAELITAAIESGSVKRFVFTSSMAVYGRGEAPFDEADQPWPMDPYGVAKLACERDLQIAGEQHGLDWCILRPHNLYGPGQNIWQPYRNVLGIWMARHLQGLPLLVYGDGSQQRAFSWIDDSLPCLWAAATEPYASRRTINLGGTRPVPIAGAASALVQVMGGGSIEHVEARHEVREAWCAWERSVELLGYGDAQPLEAGLAEMWQWAQSEWAAHPERRNRPDPFTIELRRGLYPFWAERLSSARRMPGRSCCCRRTP